MDKKEFNKQWRDSQEEASQMKRDKGATLAWDSTLKGAYRSERRERKREKLRLKEMVK